MDVKDSYLHGTIGVVKSISVNADKLTYTLADINQTATTVTLPVATQSANGLLSSADKIKLDTSTGINQSIPYIVGPDTDTTAGTWTGTYSGITEYNDGLTIIYVPKVAGASTTTLNINNIGSKVCYYTGSSKLTTHYPAGTPILLTYSGGYWKHADYDSYQLRVYRQTTGYDADYPILVSSTLASSIGTSGSNNSYSNIYGLIGNDTTKTPTINPLTGEIKAPKFTGTFNGTANSVANSLTLKIKSGSTEGTSLYTYNGAANKTLDIKQGDNVTLTAAEGSLTIAASDSKVTQTDNNNSSYLRVLLSSTSNNDTYTGSVYKSSKLYFNPSSGVLYTTKFKGTWDYDSDSRSVSTIPSDYKSAFKFVGIKNPSVIGLTNTEAGAWVSLFGWKGYSDNSGPHSWELASDNKERIWVRSGVGMFSNGSGNEDWNDWHKLAYVSDIPTKVSQLINDSGYLTGQNLTNYVTLNDIQTITGTKTFTNGVRILQGSYGVRLIGWTECGYLQFGQFDGDTKVHNGFISAIGGGYLDSLSILASNVTISGNTTSAKFITKNGTSSQFVKGDGTLDSNTYVTGGPYLPLSGGVMDTNSYISWTNINYQYSNSVADWSTVTGNGIRVFSSTTTDSGAPTTFCTALHVKGPYGFQLVGQGGSTSNTFFIRNIESSLWNTLIHSNNYNSYSPKLDGTGATGTWGINITGSASKLTTPRTLWGQSFDGSANIESVPNFKTSVGASEIIVDTVAIKLGTKSSSRFGYSSGISFNGLFGYNNSYADHIHAWIGLQGYVSGNSAETYNLVFAVNNSIVVNSSPTEYMRITPDGKVGIGTTTITEKLEVNGNIKATTFKGNLDWSYIQNKPTSLPANGGDADTVDGYHVKNLLPAYGYSYTNGYLIKTDIPAESDSMITFKIEGNGYGKVINVFTQGCFYNYKTGNSIINESCTNYGLNLEKINVFNYDDVVYLWFEQTSQYQSFLITVVVSNSYLNTQNRVVSVSNSAMPSNGVTRLKTITPYRALRSDNYTDYINTTNFPGLNKTGTVTSVGLSVPTGFSVSSSPITTSGTLSISFASGYSLPTTAKQTNWDTVYNWYTGITATDTDALVNKWGEIVDFLDSVAEGTDITDEFVTRKTDQEITGLKTFIGPLAVQSPTYKKYTKLYSIDENSNCRTIIQGGNFTHSLMLYDSFTTSGLNYATLYGGYIYDASLTLRSYDCDTTTNTASVKTVTVISTGASTFAGQVTAKKFITVGGTSSQFVKGNGDLDSTTYATMTQLEDLENQLAALSAGIKVTASLSVSTIYKNTATSVKITGTTKDNAGNITASEIVIKEGSTILATANNVATTSHTKTVTTTNSSTVFTVTAIAQGLPLSTTVTLYARYPVMYGMGTSAENVYTNGSKASARTSAVSTSTYNATASANNVRFYLLVPSDVTRPTSFTMGGAPVDMVIPTATTTIGGIAYYVFYTNAIYNSGAAVQIKAN